MNKNKKRIIITSFAILLVIIGICGFLIIRAHFDGITASNTTQYPGPTSEEANAGNSVKEEIVNENKQQESQTVTNSTEVVVTYAGYSNGVAEVNAYASYYDEGQCTITFTKGTRTITKIVDAYKDVRTTTCTNPKVPRSEFPTTGEWSIRVVYTSADGSVKGESTPQNITIQ